MTYFETTLRRADTMTLLQPLVFPSFGSYESITPQQHQPEAESSQGLYCLVPGRCSTAKGRASAERLQWLQAYVMSAKWGKLQHATLGHSWVRKGFEERGHTTAVGVEYLCRLPHLRNPSQCIKIWEGSCHKHETRSRDSNWEKRKCLFVSKSFHCSV